MSDSARTTRSFLSRYRDAINAKNDFHAIFVRPHARHATLDGARAITILLMVLFHVMFGVAVLLREKIANLDNFIATFPRQLGWLWQSQGSDPLFVMCGLLVAYTLFREYDKQGTIDILRFYQRRLMRIMPLFLLALLIYLPTDKDNIEFVLSNLIFMSNYIPGQRTVIPVGWSLDVQMHFYLLLPFLLLLMYKLHFRISFLVGLFVASVAWRYFIVVRNPEIWQTPFYQIFYDSTFGRLLADQLYYDLDVRIGCFFAGMIVAYLHYYHGKQIQAFFERHLLASALMVFAGAAMIAGALYFPIENKYHPFYENFDPNFNLWHLVLSRYTYTTGLCFLLLSALCPAGLGRAVNWVLSWKIWHPVAQLIFPIYLFHFPFIVIGALLTFWTVDRDSIAVVHVWQVFSIFFWAVLLTMAFSVLVHLYVEKPFLNMRKADGIRDHSAIPNTVNSAIAEKA